MSSPLLIVSNRLPISANLVGNHPRLGPVTGGLASGLKPWHERCDGRWIGWPGDVSPFTTEQRGELDALLATRRIVPVHLSRDQIDRYYNGFSNRVLWPLFHCQIDRVPVDATGWDAYREVNERFVEVIAREYRPGDAVWVHDYQLMLVPALLRARLPDVRIGFFLHIPFPPSEVFRILPWRSDVLQGLLGADLIGFHTFAYLRHFLASLLHVDGVEAEVDRVRVGRREVRLGVFPMGVDAQYFSALADDPAVIAAADQVRRDADHRRILLGVDRLDYTKGIPRRLHAIERLLTREPALAEQIRYLQLAVPSRENVDSYQRFKRQVEESVGRINGSYGSFRSSPVQYIHRSVTPAQLVALYRAADVMLVTPLRDGMNLVAKEFVASRPDGDGVLVLSELAGAASELEGAIVVNPYDVDGLADTIRQALAMPVGERRTRMEILRRRVFHYDVHRWAATFVKALERSEPSGPNLARPVTASQVLELLAANALELPRRLLLDYDGTLVPIAAAPELASPDQELIELLAAFGSSLPVTVEIVSGRPRETLEAWLGHLPITLWAEHGLWYRPAGGADWTATMQVHPDWASRVLPILEQFAESTPGARVEIKTASLSWHYRAADPEFGLRQAHELRMLLGDALSNQPLEVIEGKKVIEVRLRGVSKAILATGAEAAAARGAAVAFGDDGTDEELFRALPEGSLTIAIGGPIVHAKYWMESYRDVRSFLLLLSSALEQSLQRRD